MALTMNWATRTVSIPQADLALVSGTLYELDTNAFRLALKALEASPEGMSFPDAHRHNTIATVAGVTFARLIEIINGYAVEFEPGAYSVRLAGSNNNLFDVEAGILQQNTVQVIAQNSAGLVVVTGVSGLTPTQSTQLAELHRKAGLDPASPVDITDNSIATDDIDIAISQPSATTTRLTRQP